LAAHFAFACFCKSRAKSECFATSLHAASAGVLPVNNATVTHADAGASPELLELAIGLTLHTQSLRIAPSLTSHVHRFINVEVAVNGRD